MKKGKYESLRAIYPETISKIQLYQICRISPRSAQYLLENKIIPSIDTGRKTWRYRIALDDVITYLRKRDQVGSMIPSGAVNSKVKQPKTQRKPYYTYVNRGLEARLPEYFRFIFADYPDILSATGVAEMTGLCKKTILAYLKSGKLKSMGFGENNNYIIPKKYVLEFAASPAFVDCKSNSETYKTILGGLELWLNAR